MDVLVMASYYAPVAAHRTASRDEGGPAAEPELLRWGRPARRLRHWIRHLRRPQPDRAQDSRARPRDRHLDFFGSAGAVRRAHACGAWRDAAAIGGPLRLHARGVWLLLGVPLRLDDHA